MSNVQNIVIQTRRFGSTTWILKSAIKNPKCVIVCKDMHHAMMLEQMYHKMLLNEWWGKKLWWKLFPKDNPKFLGLSSNFIGLGLPIIFDNSALN